MILRAQQWMSRAVILLTDAKVGWLKNLLIRLFIIIYKPKMEEVICQRPEHYGSFNEFFARRLNPGARPLAANALVSPADGRLVAAGSIHNNRVGGAANQTAHLDNIKGKSYSVAALLGLDAQAAADARLLRKFSNGSYATIYLAPPDYHRVHFPCKAKIIRANFIPGYLYSVNDKSCAKRPSLYAYNQRLACICETPHGLLGIVMVAALLVSRITAFWGQRHGALDAAITDTTPRKFRQGDELGYFSMGSSVVLLWEQPNLLPAPAINTKLQMGQLLYKL